MNKTVTVGQILSVLNMKESNVEEISIVRFYKGDANYFDGWQEVYNSDYPVTMNVEQLDDLKNEKVKKTF